MTEEKTEIPPSPPGYGDKVQLAIVKPDRVNYQGWLRNALQFINEKGLEHQFRDWCGGWPCPVKPGPSESLVPTSGEVTMPAGVAKAAVLALRSYQCGNSAPALAAACAAQLETFSGPVALPAPPGEELVPQNAEEILLALIGDLGGLNFGQDPAIAARQLQAALAAAMSLLAISRRRSS